MRVLVATAFAALAATSCASSVGPWMKTEKAIAKANLLANIGSSGSRAPGAFPGMVVASPSTVDPDYYYHWIRDSSLVFKLIIDLYTQGHDNSLRSHIDEFLTASSHLQTVNNPSGTTASGNNLGEPKFYVNETAFEGSWGRPQRDGPALRSTALITYANYLLDSGNATFVTNTIWPVVQTDLNYVAQNWNQTTYDLWEEVRSSSFFTTAVQHRALREGATLAQKLGKSVPTWTTQADNALCFLQSYWSAKDSHAIANFGQRSGVDANTVLASIHSFDAQAGCDAATFQPCSDKALANLKTYVESFRSVYPLNSAAGSGDALAVGRYAEDVYYNGNPWYLANFAVAQQLYDALYVWDQQKSLTVTSTSLAFFKTFSADIKTGTYKSSSDQYKSLTKAIAAYADGFVAIAAKYVPEDGSISEQFDKATGKPTSAVHLTWSYAAALTVIYARDSTMIPASWGAKGLTVPSGTCKTGPTAPVVKTTFNVNATTAFGENIYLVGSVDALVAWDPSRALLLDASKYPTWSVTVDLPVDTHVEYKYIRKTPPSTGVTWESDPNMAVDTPLSGNLITADVWR